MKTYFNRSMILLIGAVAFCLFATSSALATEYTITDLGTLGGTKSEAWGINNHDEVVGLAYLPGDIVYHAFLYSGGAMTDLGKANCTDPYGKSVARRINDSGHIAGASCFWVPGNFTRAFLYSGGVMKDLGTLGGSQSEAWGINNSGHVVGSAAISGDGANHAFLYSGGVMTDIGTLGSGAWSWAYGINDFGQIVGSSYYLYRVNIDHAFLYSGGVMTDITPTVGCCSKAYDINNSGQVVGTSPFPGTYTHPFLYSGGVLTDLGSFGGPHPEARGEAWSINDQGQIVGWSHIPGPIPHAFLYENGLMKDLNSMLPAGSGWELNYALDINDNGRIVGVGTINGQSHAFLMTPKTPYTLTVTKTGTGSGTVTSNPEGIDCGGDCDEVYDEGTEVTLTATADAGSTFAGWSGDCDVNGQVTMDANKTCTATFTLNQYVLTVNKTGTGTGTVTSNPAGINCGGDCDEVYNHGTVVTLTPTPAAGSTFTGWSGDCESNGQVTMDATKTCTATFNDTTEFVKQQYRDFLNREAEPAGLQFWVNMINSGAMTRAQVIESFFWSQEFGATIAPVVRLYFAYFLRIPDSGGLLYWINAYKSGGSLGAISDAFAGSDEFVQRYGALSNGEFVNLVYQNILGRAPDPGGYVFWVGELNSGRRTRGQVMIGFSESDEYKGLTSHEVYVTMMYVGMLRRSPEDEGFNFWVDYLDSDHSGLALIDGFLNSQEYADRFQ